MITCIMAAHNAATTIAAAVESVLRQTHADLELIVVDDGSTDQTRIVLANIRDPRITVLHQPRRGPSAARNLALAHAKGEFIAPIDADDIWLPTKLERQLHALQNHPTAAVAYGWTDFVDQHLRPLYPDGRATFVGNVLEPLLRLNFISCGSNTLMRRSALEQTGAFDESLQATEDWELHTRLAARYDFVAVPEVVVLYRRTPQSLSSRFWIMERNFLAANRKIFADLTGSARHLESQTKASFYRYILFQTMQSKGTAGKWKAIPRFAALAAWHDACNILRSSWRAGAR